MSPISHEFHKMVGKAFDELKLPDEGFVVLKDPALDENGHKLPLFYQPEDEQESDKDTRLRGKIFTEVDMLVLHKNEIKIVVEIEESNFKPIHLFGKYFASEMSSYYIYRPEKGKGIECWMADEVLFIQLLGSKRIHPDSQKTIKWENVEKAIRKHIKVKTKNITQYCLLYCERNNKESVMMLKRRLRECLEHFLD